MLDQLTDYLLQYKRVSIPHIGSFVVQRQPAQLNIADRLIEPPAYAVSYEEAIQVRDHQLSFITDGIADKTETLHELEHFGKTLKHKIEKDAFTWRGIGLLHWQDDKIIFEPQEITTGWQPVSAHKVIRERATHTVLVGDQQVQKSEAAPPDEQPAEIVRTSNKNMLMWVGWIIMALAVLFILYHFITTGLRAEATGLKAKPAIEAAPPLHD